MVYVIIAMFFVHGLGRTGSVIIGYIIVTDIAPERTHAMLTAITSFSEGLVFIELTVYYRFISKHTSYTLYFNLVLTAICATLMLIFVPESPKWLYEQQRYQECHEIMEKVASVNGKLLSTGNKLLQVNPQHK